MQPKGSHSTTYSIECSKIAQHVFIADLSMYQWHVDTDASCCASSDSRLSTAARANAEAASCSTTTLSTYVTILCMNIRMILCVGKEVMLMILNREAMHARSHKAKCFRAKLHKIKRIVLTLLSRRPCIASHCKQHPVCISEKPCLQKYTADCGACFLNRYKKLLYTLCIYELMYTLCILYI